MTRISVSMGPRGGKDRKTCIYYSEYQCRMCFHFKQSSERGLKHIHTRFVSECIHKIVQLLQFTPNWQDGNGYLSCNKQTVTCSIISPEINTHNRLACQCSECVESTDSWKSWRCQWHFRFTIFFTKEKFYSVSESEGPCLFHTIKSPW